MTIAPNSSVARDIPYITHPNGNYSEHEKAGSLIIERCDIRSSMRYGTLKR